MMIDYCQKTLFLLFLLLAVEVSVAQDQRVMPSSPEAATLAKYRNFPVGNNNGVPDIQIPLATVDLAGLELPIALSYHAGGFKVNEPSGPVGIGWSLSTDLQISREIKGREDWGYYRTSSSFQGAFGPNTVREYIELLTNLTDRQPDKFHYRILGKSGTFYFRKETNGTIVAETIPHTGVQIEWVAMNCFKLTDTDGTVYWFGTKGFPTAMDNVERTSRFGSGVAQTDITAWKCSVIELAATGEEIELTYGPKADYDYSYVFQDKVELLDQPSPCQGGSAWGPGNMVYPDEIGTSVWRYQYGHTGTQLYDSIPLHWLPVPKYFNHSLGQDGGLYVVWEKTDRQWYNGNWHNIVTQENTQYEERTNDIYYRTESRALQHITYRGGRINFNWSTTRNSLTSIEIRSKVGTTETLENKIDFSYVTPSCPTPTFQWGSGYYRGSYYLSNVKTGIATGAQKYSFDYRNLYCFGNYSKGSDPWGGINRLTKSQGGLSAVPHQRAESIHYKNDRCDGSNAVPLEVEFGHLDLDGQFPIEPDTALMKSGILKRITYPTGGYTEFEFGANKYRDSYGYTRTAGGLRIERISYFDGLNNFPTSEKSYRYGELEYGEESDVGIISNIPSLDMVGFEHYGGYSYEQALVYVESSGGHPVTYWYEVGRERKRTYLARPLLDMFYSGGAPVKYTRVSEYGYKEGMLSGKTVYDYEKNVISYGNPSTWIQGTNITVEQSDYHIGMLDSVTQYAFVNNAFEWVHRKIYQYNEYTRPSVWSAQVFQNTQYWGVNNVSNQGYVLHNDLGETGDYNYILSELKVGAMRTTSETEKWKEDGREVIKTTNYFYDTGRLRPNRIETSLSGGKQEITYLRYPYHYSAGVDFAQAMTIRNMVYHPVERVKAVRENGVTRIVSGEILEYDVDYPGLVKRMWNLQTDVPVASGSFAFSNGTSFAPDPRYRISSQVKRDIYGNTIRITEKEGNVTSYKWSYDHVYPIAMCQNALETEFFYEGFEENGVLGEAKAGRRFHTGSYSLGFAAPSGKNYKYSYWYRMSGTWIYSGELDYTGPVTLGGGNAIDEVRVFPADAHLTTYTYHPTVGVGSVTDAKGQTISYTYDYGNRLSEVRDQYGNIVKTYCYDYAGLPTNCAIPGASTYYSNVMKQQTYTKNNCELGGSGLVVQYIVPAGRYRSAVSQADADNMALEDVQANGQAYANAVGGCRPNIRVTVSVQNRWSDLNNHYADFLVGFSDYNWQTTSVSNLKVNYGHLRTRLPYYTAVVLGRYQKTFSGTSGVIALNAQWYNSMYQWDYRTLPGRGYISQGFPF